MLGVAPILPSRDLEATSAFYSQLGFEQEGLWPDFFSPKTDPFASVAGCYLYVAVADALLALREFALADHDGNQLRIGSFLADPG
jgi:catechol 2,3-dioxygenase-like lactoylglutathione lyase family enzyme